MRSNGQGRMGESEWLDEKSKDGDGKGIMVEFGNEPGGPLSSTMMIYISLVSGDKKRLDYTVDL